MSFIKEIFREIKIRGHLEELRDIQSNPERIKRLNEILIQINISKESLSFYTPDEQLYLFSKIQEEGIDMGLCQEFHIFFSNRNQRFHHICRATKRKERSYCGGEIKRCDKTPKFNKC